MNDQTTYRAKSPDPTKLIKKRMKELTPNSKAPRKRPRKTEDVLEDSIKKIDSMHVSPTKTALVLPTSELKDEEDSVVRQDKQHVVEIKDGSWTYVYEDAEKLPYEDIHALVDDINNLIYVELYQESDVIKPEKDDNVCIMPEDAVPIRADVRKFDFQNFMSVVEETRGRKFDIIMMDPPWKLTTANPTRGVSISYACLTDQELLNLPVPELQTDGFLFIWVINSKMALAWDMFDKWGYKVLDSVDWVKMTVNRRVASGHGYYLQHAAETCLIGRKGSFPPGYNESHNVPDIIYSLRRGQSQKPEEIYEYCEDFVHDGLFLEIFGRRNNLRNGWITIGNEI